MKLIPQGNRLLVEMIEEVETQTPIQALKLILPEEKQSYGLPLKGKIIAVGNGSICLQMDLKEGDIVYFSKYAGQPMKISPRAHEQLGDFKEAATYLFLNTKDIYGREYAAAVNE